MKRIKTLLKSFWPASSNTFNAITCELKADMQKNSKLLLQHIQQMENIYQKVLDETQVIKGTQQQLQAELTVLKEKQTNIQKEQLEVVCQQMNRVQEALNQEINKIQDSQNNGYEQYQEILKQEISCLRKNQDVVAREMGQKILDSKKTAEEAVWAQVFNNTITDSSWLKDKTFSPGRWALGYPALYTVYRILNEIKPTCILELGLGQSTRLIGQYTTHYAGVSHTVVEHDQQWIRFFKNDFELLDRTEIVQLDWGYMNYKEAEEVRVFDGFKEKFEGQKFDFICIDAPLAGDMKQYGRIDILHILPECLGESFVIVVDDAERVGEKATINQIQYILESNNIGYKKGVYNGKKDLVIITSINNKFLCSM